MSKKESDIIFYGSDKVRRLSEMTSGERLEFLRDSFSALGDLSGLDSPNGLRDLLKPLKHYQKALQMASWAMWVLWFVAQCTNGMKVILGKGAMDQIRLRNLFLEDFLRLEPAKKCLFWR